MVWWRGPRTAGVRRRRPACTRVRPGLSALQLLLAAFALLALAPGTLPAVAQAQTVPSPDATKYRIGVHSSSTYATTLAYYKETANYLNSLLFSTGLANRTVEFVPISFLGNNVGVNFYAWSILALSPPVLDAVLAPSANIICLGKANPGARPMAGLVSYSADLSAEEEFYGPAMISKANMTSMSDIANRRLAFYDPRVRKGKGRP